MLDFEIVVVCIMSIEFIIIICDFENNEDKVFKFCSLFEGC